MLARCLAQPHTLRKTRRGVARPDYVYGGTHVKGYRFQAHFLNNPGVLNYKTYIVPALVSMFMGFTSMTHESKRKKFPIL